MLKYSSLGEQVTRRRYTSTDSYPAVELDIKRVVLSDAPGRKLYGARYVAREFDLDDSERDHPERHDLSYLRLSANFASSRKEFDTTNYTVRLTDQRWDDKTGRLTYFIHETKGKGLTNLERDFIALSPEKFYVALSDFVGGEIAYEADTYGILLKEEDIKLKKDMLVDIQSMGRKVDRRLFGRSRAVLRH
jgi:hypothetical protein